MKTLLQKEVDSKVCYNYSVATMDGPLEFSQKIWKTLITEYCNRKNLSTPVELKVLEEYDSIISDHLLLIKQINEIGRFNDNFNFASNIHAVLIPDEDLVLYTHSYVSIRLLVSNINRLNVQGISEERQKRLREDIDTFLRALLGYLKPTISFLRKIGTDFTAIIAQTLESKNEPSHSAKVSIDINSIESKISSKNLAALKESISLPIEKPELVKELLNPENRSWDEQIKILDGLSETKNLHTTAGELLLIKILHDLSHGSNETLICSLLIEILQLVDHFDREKLSNTFNIDFGFLSSELWYAKAIFNLADELAMKQGTQVFPLIESCLDFLYSYWKKGDINHLIDTRRKFLDVLFAEDNYKFFAFLDRVIKLWIKNAKYDLNNLETVLEMEFTYASSTGAVLNWLEMLGHICIAFNQTNALHQAALYQGASWLYSEILALDLVNYFIPLSIYRKIKDVFKMIFGFSDMYANIFQPEKILEKIRQLCSAVDTGILDKRDLSMTEQHVLLNYLHLLFELSKIKKGRANVILRDLVLKSKEFSDFMEFNWKNETRGNYLKAVIYRLLLDASQDIRSQNRLGEPNFLPTGWPSRYFTALSNAGSLTLHDLNMIMILPKYGFAWMKEIMKFSSSLKNWILKSFTDDNNCFISPWDMKRLFHQYLEPIRWENDPDKEPFANAFSDYLIETAKAIVESLNSKIEECLAEMHGEKRSETRVRKLQNKLFRAFHLACYWIEAVENTQSLNYYFKKIDEVALLSQPMIAVIRILLLIPCPFFNEKKIGRIYSSKATSWKNKQEYLLNIARSFIVLTNSIEREHEIETKATGFPFKEERIGNELVNKFYGNKTATVKRFVRFQAFFSDFGLHVSTSSPDNPTLQSLAQTGDLISYLADGLSQTWRVFMGYLAQQPKPDEKAEGYFNETQKLEKIKQTWRDMCEYAISMALNDRSHTMKLIKETSTRISKNFDEFNMPDDAKPYMTALDLFLEIFRIKGEYCDAYKTCTQLKSHFAVDFIQKVTNFTEKVDEKSNHKEISSWFTSFVGTALFQSLVPATFIDDKTLGDASENELVLDSLMKSWEGAWKRACMSESWRRDLLRMVLQRALFILIVKHNKAVLQVSPPNSKSSNMLKEIQSHLQKFKVQAASTETNFSIEAGDAAGDLQPKFEISKLLENALETLAYTGNLKVLTEFEWKQDEYFMLIPTLLRLFKKQKDRLVNQVKLLIDPNGDSQRTSNEFGEIIYQISNDLEAIAYLTECQLFSYLVLHFNPEVSDKISALPMSEVCDFLLFFAQKAMENEDSQTEKIFINSLKSFVLWIDCIRWALVCYFNDKTSGLIAGSQKLLIAMEERLEKLLPVLCSFCVKNSKALTPDVLQALYDLVTTFLHVTEVEKSAVRYDPAVIELLVIVGLRYQDKILHGANLLLDSSFSAAAYTEALIKFSIYHSEDGIVSEQHKQGQSIGCDILQDSLEKIPEFEGISRITERLLLPIENLEGSFKIRENVNLATVQVSPDAPEQDFFEFIIRFADHPASKFIDCIIDVIVKGLTPAALTKKHFHIEDVDSLAPEGLFALEELYSILLNYPFLAPYLFFKDLSQFFESDNPLLETLERSQVTEMINTRIFNKSNKKTKAPFGAYLFETLIVLASPAVFQLFDMLLGLPIPLLFKDANEHKGYLSFNSFVRSVLETRVLEGLKKLNENLRNKDTSRNQEKLNFLASRELHLSAYLPLNVWRTKVPLASKEQFTNEILHEMLTAFLLHQQYTEKCLRLEKLIEMVETGVLAKIMDCPRDALIKPTIFEELWEKQSKVLINGDENAGCDTYTLSLRSFSQGKLFFLKEARLCGLEAAPIQLQFSKFCCFLSDFDFGISEFRLFRSAGFNAKSSLLPSKDTKTREIRSGS